jgi:N-acetylglutamate synthase-like GNAT family acetyltransferase
MICTPFLSHSAFTLRKILLNLPPMSAPQYSARRATLDDIPALRRLWAAEKIADLHLEKRIGDFQLAQDATGKILGAIGLQVEGLHGRVHSESFEDFGLTDTLRPLLWERVLSISRNRGLVRLWTLDTTLFYRTKGFDPVDEESAKKFPAPFGDAHATWFTLKLKEDILTGLSEDQEFALFKEAAKAESDKMMQQAKIMKWVATVVAFLFLILVVIAGGYVLRLMKYKETHGTLPKAPVQQKR